MRTMNGPIAIVTLLAVFTLWPSQAIGASAADLYKTKCVMCHGADGSGKTPMGKRLGLRDLRSEEIQKQPDSELMEAIQNGKGKMPAQKGHLGKDEIRQLVGYVRELAKKQ
jgi:cytochrome c6